MLSRRSRAALAAMQDVARLARGSPVPAKVLTARDGMAPRQLEAVLQTLVHAGLLRSLRGPQGGYVLARERRRISVGDVVRAIDDLAPDEADRSAIAVALGAATRAFLAELDRVTLADLCRAEERTGEHADFHI